MKNRAATLTGLVLGLIFTGIPSLSLAQSYYPASYSSSPMYQNSYPSAAPTSYSSHGNGNIYYGQGSSLFPNGVFAGQQQSVYGSYGNSGQSFNNYGYMNQPSYAPQYSAYQQQPYNSGYGSSMGYGMGNGMGGSMYQQAYPQNGYGSFYNYNAYNPSNSYGGYSNSGYNNYSYNLDPNNGHVYPYSYAIPTGDRTIYGTPLCQWSDYDQGRTPCGYDPQQWLYDPYSGQWY